MAFYRRRPVGRYGRKRFGLRRKRAGGSWMRYGAKAGGLAYKAYKGFQYLRGLINVEHQKVDFTVVNGAQSTTPTITHVTAIAVGDAEGSRTGNSILAKYIYLKGSLLLNTSANATKIRFVLLRDKQQIADTAPSYTDVYEAANTLSFLNKLTVGRFDILWDKNYDLDANNPQALMDKYIRLNSHVRYNGTASTDQQKGALYCMVISDQATNTPTLSIAARLMYIDN